MLGLVVGAAAIVGGIWGVMALKDNSINNDIEEIQEFIDSPDTKKKLDHRDKLIAMKEKVNDYNTKILNAYDAFYSQPVVDGDKYDTLQAVLDKTAEELEVKEAKILHPAYANGVFTFAVEYEQPDEKKLIEEVPAQFIMNLTDKNFKENKGYYANAAYSGYNVSVQTESQGEGDDASSEEKTIVTFNVSTAINGRESAYHPSNEDSAEEAAE
jgi:type IV pilus assembly protein PilM